MTPPLPRHHGIVKCPSYAYYRIRAEVVGHPGILAYCFSNTMNSDILLASHTVFHILYSREVCDFGRTGGVFVCMLQTRVTLTTSPIATPRGRSSKFPRKGTSLINFTDPNILNCSVLNSKKTNNKNTFLR